MTLQCCRFKEAVNECTSALDKCTPAIPAYHKALVRRAKAYEQMGHFKQALSDIQKANKADTANPETQACILSSCCYLCVMSLWTRWHHLCSTCTDKQSHCHHLCTAHVHVL